MELILPGPACEASYRQAIEEYARAGLSPTCFFGGAERCPDGLFARFADYRAGQNLPAGYVPCTSLWLVDGDEFLAEVSIRHRLTPALERFGGHIGYAVRAGRWGQGLGTKLLAGALDVPVAVMETAGEGGPWGMALLAAYRVRRAEGQTLEEYLADTVFRGAQGSVQQPDAADTAGFARFLTDYKSGLAVEKAAAAALR